MTHLLETRRQIFHLLAGTSISALIFLLPKEISLSLLTSSALLIYLLRNSYRDYRPLRKIITAFERRKDSQTGNAFKGALYLVIGSSFPLLFFPPPTAAAGALVLAFGDSFATLIGHHHGKTRINGPKTAEGATAFLISAFLVLNIFVPIRYAFLVALACTAIELFLPIDDNLALPISAAFLISL